MTTAQIAHQLKTLCEQGKFDSALKELFATDAVSIEPRATSDFDKETKGLDGLLAKGDKWNKMVEKQHSFEISEPVVAGQSFALTMHFDVTMKERGRMDMTELCLYKVENGKIVSEEFFM